MSRKRQTKITCQVEEITPERAAFDLENHHHGNRKHKPAIVNRLASYMPIPLTGESVIYDWDGNLRDGQHRYMACVKSGKSFSVVVVRGVDPAAFSATGQGTARSGKDVLDIEGYQNTLLLAGAVRWVGTFARESIRGGMTGKFQNQEILRLVRAMPDIEELVSLSASLIKKRDRRHRFPILVAFWYIQRDLGYGDQVDDFVNQIVTGIDVRENSPAAALRLFMSRNDEAFEGGSEASATYANCLLHAWEHEKKGSDLRALRRPKRDQVPELSPALARKLAWVKKESR